MASFWGLLVCAPLVLHYVHIQGAAAWVITIDPVTHCCCGGMVVGQLHGPALALQAGWCYWRVVVTYLELLLYPHGNQDETRCVVELGTCMPVRVASIFFLYTKRITAVLC